MRGKNLFKKTDMRRAIDTARRAGLFLARVDITKDGTISLVTGKGEGEAARGADLDNWLAKEGRGARPA
jgi:hypothetical protein